MRVLVCGGRKFEDRAMLWDVLDGLHAQHRFSVIIHGAQKGADTLADHWALANKIPPYRFHAAWTQHGNAAGPIRNARMLAKGKPDLVVAFPGSNGTNDMMNKALAAKVAVLRVRPDGTLVPWGFSQTEMSL
jgi:hypothetical protein